MYETFSEKFLLEFSFPPPKEFYLLGNENYVSSFLFWPLGSSDPNMKLCLTMMFHFMGCMFRLFSLILVSYFYLYFPDLDFLFLVDHHLIL